MLTWDLHKTTPDNQIFSCVNWNLSCRWSGIKKRWFKFFPFFEFNMMTYLVFEKRFIQKICQYVNLIQGLGKTNVYFAIIRTYLTGNVSLVQSWKKQICLNYNYISRISQVSLSSPVDETVGFVGDWFFSFFFFYLLKAESFFFLRELRIHLCPFTSRQRKFKEIMQAVILNLDQSVCFITVKSHILLWLLWELKLQMILH